MESFTNLGSGSNVEVGGAKPWVGRAPQYLGPTLDGPRGIRHLP